MEKAVTLFQSALYKTRSAVIRTDDLVLVVDPCWLPHEVEAIRQRAEAVREGRPLYLLFTHSDYDHIIGYRAFPDARVIASKSLADKKPDERAAIVEQIRVFDDEYYVERGYPIAYPEVDHAIAGEGEIVQIGGTRLTGYQSPGHTDDGLLTVVEPLGLLLAGDYLSDVEFPYFYHSSRDYEQTLRKLEPLLERHEIRMLIPGHGAPTSDRAEMLRRQAKDAAYIAALRAAVAAGDETGIDGLIAGCPFPRSMAKSHQANRLLIERELQKGQG